MCDITNGNRFETYVIPGERGAGDISVQGAAAKLCNKGDRLIIMSFDVTDRPIESMVILVDENNRFVEYLQGGGNEGELSGILPKPLDMTPNFLYNLTHKDVEIRGCQAKVIAGVSHS